MIELRQGTWQTALADIECDALISDPPYGERTHRGQRHGRREGKKNKGDYVSARGIGYDHLTPPEVDALVAHWSPRTRGWMVFFTSHDLVPVYERALQAQGRYVFAPLPTVQIGMNVRLAGDGPSNWTCWLVVARPTGKPPWGGKWGTKPGAYVGNPFDLGQNHYTATRKHSVVGSKPLWLMRAIVRDYSTRGQLVIDPFAGGASTLIAAASLHRRALGAEVDAHTYDYANKRIAHWMDAPLFGPREQLALEDYDNVARETL